MENKVALVLVLACTLVLAGCLSGPKPVDRTGGVGQLDAGVTLVDGGAQHVANASGATGDAQADIEAARQREADRTAALAEQARILADGTLSIDERLEKCQRLIDESRERLQRYIEGSGSGKKESDKGGDGTK